MWLDNESSSTFSNWTTNGIEHSLCPYEQLSDCGEADVPDDELGIICIKSLYVLNNCFYEFSFQSTD